MRADDLHVKSVYRLAAQLGGHGSTAASRRCSPGAVIWLFPKAKYVKEVAVLTAGQVRVLN